MGQDLGMRFNATKCSILGIKSKSQEFYNLAGHIYSNKQVQHKLNLGLHI